MSMIKLLIGLVLIALPISLYVYDLISAESLPYGIEPIRSLVTVIMASIPPLVALIGLFLLWLGYDEWATKPKEDENEKEEDYKKIKDIVKGEYKEE